MINVSQMATRSRRARASVPPRPAARRGNGGLLASLAAFRWQAAALAAAVLLAYWNSLGASFHFDDWSLFSDPYVTGAGAGIELFRLSQTRPLTYWTFHLNYLAGGMDPFGYHAVNLLLHAANVMLVLWIARRHVPASGAFLAAGLFALHPLQTEAVTYVFARASLLAAVLALGSFALFVRGRYALSALAFGFSLLAKEETIALPAFVLLYDWLFVASKRAGALPPDETGRLGQIARRWPYYAALAAMCAAAAARLFYVLRALPDPGIGFRVEGITAWSYALTQTRVLWHYLRLVVAPAGQNLDYDFELSVSLFSPPVTVLAVAALAASLTGLIYVLFAGRRSEEVRRAAFWTLGFFLLLSPSSSIVPQSDMLFEHRVYFPLASLVIALAGVLSRALEKLPRPAARTAVTAAVLLACGAATIARNQVWATEEAMWSDVVRKSPNKGRPYIGLARGLVKANRPLEARRALERGVALDPRSPELRTNLGIAFLQEGRPAEALPHFRHVLENGRETPEARNNQGAALYQLGEREAALKEFSRAIELNPCFLNARRNLMMGLAEAGRPREGLEAGEPPSHCRLVPEQARELEQFRDAVAQRVRQEAGR